MRDVPILVKTMRDFVGIQNVSDVVKSALLDFSFYLTLGKLDDAYRVVKDINSPSIWENMAQMCVKTKRIDVAEVCLGNMGNARGAAAVREAKKEGCLEVTIGVLAIQLGLLDEAANLFREAQRYDLLNGLYQASGLWDKSIQIAKEKDRIHLKSTHFKFAKYLESVGSVEEAMDHFELSGNARTEVPRLLFHLGRVDELGEYVLRSDDLSLSKWWASYLESIDRLDKAKKYYSKAKDYLSLVRIYCFKGDLQKAADIVNETGDRASAYHFARQLEAQGEFQEAITFYALSGCYNHSIRLAR
jgi:intraflagellar transport protein 140